MHQDAVLYCRLLFACGTIEAFTCATSQSASASCAMWQASIEPMWDAVSAVAQSAASDSSLQAVTASVQEADAWGQETGQQCSPVFSCHALLLLNTRTDETQSTERQHKACVCRVDLPDCTGCLVMQSLQVSRPASGDSLIADKRPCCNCQKSDACLADICKFVQALMALGHC